MNSRAIVGVAALSAALGSSVASADPWLAPGNEALRHDIQLLADAGILRGPVTTWPLSWPDIARDVNAAGQSLDGALMDALLRVQRQARVAAGYGFSGFGVRAAAASEPLEMRSFADSPREEAELAFRASWLGDHVAVNLQGTAVADPQDDRRLRPDGSYIGVNVGNFMISAGWMERWWGPGWDGSLILSTNARPIPALTIERNYTDPFKTKLLSWLGPWRASIAIGEAERHDVAVAGVKFMAARVNFKPRSWLEIGLSRTAQWCGGDRECNWGTFTDMLLGQDNQEDPSGLDAQPGNQMAGYDLRLRSPWKRLPVAFFAQMIGEDEAGGLPSKFLGNIGLEGWHALQSGSFRLRLEYTDTACTFTRQEPDFNCAYRNGLYPQGYSFRGRIIGSSLDNDSRSYSLGLQWARADGQFYSLTARSIELNRDGGPHEFSSVPAKLKNVELRHSRELGPGTLAMGVSYDDAEVPALESKLRGFANWSLGF